MQSHLRNGSELWVSRSFDVFVGRTSVYAFCIATAISGSLFSILSNIVILCGFLVSKFEYTYFFIKVKQNGFKIIFSSDVVMCACVMTLGNSLTINEIALQDHVCKIL